MSDIEFRLQINHVVNWPVGCNSLCSIFGEYMHIVLVSHGDMTSIISRHSTCSGIFTLASISDLEFGKMIGNENQGAAHQAVSPGTSQTLRVQQPPIVTRSAGSSHSSILESGSSSAAITAATLSSLVQRFRLIVSITPTSSKVMTSIVPPGSPQHAPIGRANVSIVSSLAKRSSNAVAPRISMSGLELFSPLCFGFPSGSTGISDVELIVGVHPPMSGSRTLVLSSYQPVYSVSTGSRKPGRHPGFHLPFGSVCFCSRPGEKPDPGYLGGVVTRTGHGTVGFRLGWNRPVIPNIWFLHFPLQFSILVMIVSWYGQYVDCVVLCALSPPASRFVIWPTLAKSLWNNIIFKSKFAGFRQQLNVYWSDRKSDSGRWKSG